ncbi:MAG: TraR/DksA family transcriptional regulator, partial [Candidatus Omnitrophota bacterium]
KIDEILGRVEGHIMPEEMAELKANLEGEYRQADKVKKDLEDTMEEELPQDSKDALPLEEEKEIDDIEEKMEFDKERRVAEALGRMSKGTYGYCQKCKGPIPVERLKALPYAELCVKCETEKEKRGK